MQIRLMKKDDYDSLLALWVSCAGMGLNALDDSRQGIERFLLRNPGTCFVAEADGALLGAILAGNDGRRGYIYHMAVHPDFRRQGIAARLTAAATQALKDCGIHKVALVVFSRNREGNAFWENQGFTVREDLTYRNKALADLPPIDT